MISLLLFLIAAILNAVMDTLAHHHGSSIFKTNRNYSFWGANSWTRKYKDNNPGAGSRFWGSTTFLVFLTDGWHLSQWLMISCMVGAIIAFPSKIINGWDAIIAVFLVFRVGWGLIFELFYGKLLLRKKKKK